MAQPGDGVARRLGCNAGILAFAVPGLKAAQGDRQGAYDLLLRCWRFDAARENRFYHRAVAPDLVRLAVTRRIIAHITHGWPASARVLAGAGLLDPMSRRSAEPW